MSYMKPLPVPDNETRPFWDGCRDHKLTIQKCSACGTFRFPPGPYCAACRSKAVDWIEASGRGKIFSWIVVEHPIPKDVYGSDVPYVVAVVELEEGVRMVSNIVGCDPYSVSAEMPVRVQFDRVNETITLPRFRSADHSD
jgi:uncharacterized protein